MNDIIKIDDDLYDQYESLILLRDRLNKDAAYYLSERHNVFGKLEIALHREKLRCAKRKSAITFCTTCANFGREVDLEALKSKINGDTKSLEETIDQMVMDYENSKPKGYLTESGAKKVKECYHELAKMLHPDINPGVGSNEELMSLWCEVSTAYVNNDPKRLEELKILTVKTLGKPGERVHVPDIGEKIEAIKIEIEEIKATEPYTLKFLLEDKKLVLERKKNLLDQIKEYETYKEELDKVLNEMLPEASSIQWELN